jgi:glycosyltransferase involved in cell wall biosynthesis
MATRPPFSKVTEYTDLLQSRPRIFWPLADTSDPGVTVISSFFNAHQYFKAACHSVLNQTWQNFEWLIVDDGSTDPTAITLVEEQPQRSPKIKTLRHSVNRGPSAARNTAIAQARGKYLFFMDLDDLIDPTYIEKCVLFLETHPDFSLVNAYSVGFQDQEYWWSFGFHQPAQFIQQNWVTGRLLYRKTDFNALGGFDETLRVYEDWERWLRAITHNQQGWTIPEYLDCYRRHGSGLMAAALRQPTDNQSTLNQIRDRYQAFFSTHQLPPVHLNRPRFDLPSLRSQLHLTNPLKRNATALQVLCCFPHLEMGGADRFNLDLVTTLAARGYAFTIVTTLPADHVWHKHFYAVTPDILHLPNVLDELHWLACIQYLIESRQVDLVLISNCYIAYYFIPLLRRTFPQVAFVDFTHTTDPGWRGNGYPRLSCQFSSFLDRQIVSSQFLANVYYGMGAIAPEKLCVCYTNIATDLWQPNQQKRQKLRAKLGIADETVVLLYPARIVEQKRPLFMVDVVKALVETISSVAVIVVGDGDLLPDLRAKVSQLRLNSHFHILPPAAPTDMPDFYAASDILLLPSAYEGLSLALYEAMAMALPVVVADVGGHGELVTPETGCLVPLGESAQTEVQAYLRPLVPLVQDQALRQRIGQNARQRVAESFNLSAMADYMEKVFQAAIADRRSQPLPTAHDADDANVAIAEEMLLMALEYCRQEKLMHQLWWEKQAMETSKFWKLRRQWFRLKRFLRLTTEEIL